ncbi:hypothetical protein [Aquirufa nivalisilvae]|uniref:hypothetical protein n=1 Tax=Aquirufa nivalisilvae TaxID=2516557 RepID=UPI001032A618|nr:hypothetical protein [Aquirufa nivalisilvae]TBH73477.1 hypothetical protein EWU22_07315 [Aquirufa nivalisilvae]
MKYWGCIILNLVLYQFVYAQTTSPLTIETDEYSSYIIPSLENGILLLEANQDDFKGLMKQYRYQILQRGNELEYLSPSSRVNQMRLIRKENHQIQFLFSPTKLSLVKQLEESISGSSTSIVKDSSGMTWYNYHFSEHNYVKNLLIGIKMEADKEDRVGRTWDIWSTTIVFSKKP